MTERGFNDVLREIHERFPLVTSLQIGDSWAASDGVPAFPSVLLGVLRQASSGASCVLLPSRGRIPFAVSVFAALSTLREDFDTIELDRLTTTLRPGTRVVLAPSGRVWEVVEDGKELFGRRYIAIRNPTDGQIHHLDEAEAFRLTPTEKISPRPLKGARISQGKAAPLDRLLNIRTGGSLGNIPNRVILVAAREDTSTLARGTWISDRNCSAVPADRLLSWGRVTKDGLLESEDGPGEPLVAVTHSVDYMAEACRRYPDDQKLVVVDGLRGLSARLQAFDDASAGHRLLIIGDHGELPQARILADRGCDVWAPDPDMVLMGENGRRKEGWFARTLARSSNCRDLSIEGLLVEDPAADALHDLVKHLEEGHREDDEDAAALTGTCWSILLSVCGWMEVPAAAQREFIERRIDDLERNLDRRRIWISPELGDGLTSFISMTGQLIENGQVGPKKGAALLEALDGRREPAVITRSVAGAARVRGLLEGRGILVPVHPISRISTEQYGSLIVCSWPGRQSMSRLVSKYPTPQIVALTYPFEDAWLTSFRERWGVEWTRFSRSPDDIERITGVGGWPSKEHQPPRPTPATVPLTDDDPISRILQRRRKGGAAPPASDTDVREASYIGFHGSAFAYLTEGHKVPVLTELVLGETPSAWRIPLKPVRKVINGDYLLFRDHGDRDVISFLAAHEVGEATYEELRRLANVWRPALASIGPDTRRILSRLQAAGLNRNRLTVDTWLNDEDRIGPRSERDLEIIAKVSGDQVLSERFQDVSAAIRAIWASHVKAGFKLSQLVLQELPSQLPTLHEEPCRIEFTFGAGWIVSVEELSDVPEDRPYWETNRLLFDEEM